MTIRGQAVVSGMGALQLLASGSNAGTKAVFNTAYAEAAERTNRIRQLGAIQKNISAVKQDKILSDVGIQMKQDQAEALVKVQAAAAGVQGGSVDDTVHQTEVNESFALANNKAGAEQKTDSLLANIGGQMSALLAVPDTKQDYLGDLVTNVGNALGSASDKELTQLFGN